MRTLIRTNDLRLCVVALLLGCILPSRQVVVQAEDSDAKESDSIWQKPAFTVSAEEVHRHASESPIVDERALVELLCDEGNYVFDQDGRKTSTVRQVYQIRRREIETMLKIGGSRWRIASVLGTEILGVLLAGSTLAALLSLLTFCFASWATQLLVRLT